MWYRKAQVQPGATAPVQTADSTAISGYQIEINKILALPGKTFNEMIIALTNYKNSIDANISIDIPTKESAKSLVDTNIRTVTIQAGENFNAIYTPPQPTLAPLQPSDPSNPLSAAITPLSGSPASPGAAGGQLTADGINPRNLPPSPPPGSPAGPQSAPGAPQQAVPGKALYDAIKAAGIRNFAFEAMSANTLPLDDRSFEMVKNNLIASKSLQPGPVATLKSLLAAMGIYLTLEGNIMLFSKQKTEETPKPQSTFDTVSFKDEK
jgi:hypothetical protein